MYNIFLFKISLLITVLFIHLLSLLIISRNKLIYNLETLEVIKRKDLNKGRIQTSNTNKSEGEIGQTNTYHEN